MTVTNLNPISFSHCLYLFTLKKDLLNTWIVSTCIKHSSFSKRGFKGTSSVALTKILRFELNSDYFEKHNTLLLGPNYVLNHRNVTACIWYISSRFPLKKKNADLSSVFQCDYPKFLSNEPHELNLL